MKKVMVFGVFDGVHEGHRHLFREAKQAGDYLITAVAPDEVAADLKGRLPELPLKERLVLVEQEEAVDLAATGDFETGTWAVVKKYRPAAVVFGYDQAAAENDFRAALLEFDWPVEVKTATAFEAEKYHTSLLQRKV